MRFVRLLVHVCWGCELCFKAEQMQAASKGLPAWCDRIRRSARTGYGRVQEIGIAAHLFPRVYLRSASPAV